MRLTYLERNYFVFYGLRDAYKHIFSQYSRLFSGLRHFYLRKSTKKTIDINNLSAVFRVCSANIASLDLMSKYLLLDTPQY